jgi:16S rRNA processing protein RimM
MDRVVLGRVTGPYGLRGWLKLHLFGDGGLALADMPVWWFAVDAEGDGWSSHHLQQLKVHGKGLIAKFDGVDDRTAAEALDGCFISAPRDTLPVTPEGEYYWADLVGLSVVNSQGERLGSVTRLMSHGAHDVLCVCDGSGNGTQQERLLPFVAQVVQRVDTARREILVDWGVDW